MTSLKGSIGPENMFHSLSFSIEDDGFPDIRRNSMMEIREKRKTYKDQFMNLFHPSTKQKPPKMKRSKSPSIVYKSSIKSKTKHKRQSDQLFQSSPTPKPTIFDSKPKNPRHRKSIASDILDKTRSQSASTLHSSKIRAKKSVKKIQKFFETFSPSTKGNKIEPYTANIISYQKVGSDWRPNLDTIMKDRQLHTALLQFCERTYCDENILFLTAIRKLNAKISLVKGQVSTDSINSLEIVNDSIDSKIEDFSNHSVIDIINHYSPRSTSYHLNRTSSLPSLNRYSNIIIPTHSNNLHEGIDNAILEIYDEFIGLTAPSQVNVSHQCLQKLKAQKKCFYDYTLFEKSQLFSIATLQIENLVKHSILLDFYSSVEFSIVASSRPKNYNPNDYIKTYLPNENITPMNQKFHETLLSLDDIEDPPNIPQQMSSSAANSSSDTFSPIELKNSISSPTAARDSVLLSIATPRPNISVDTIFAFDDKPKNSKKKKKKKWSTRRRGTPYELKKDDDKSHSLDSDTKSRKTGKKKKKVANKKRKPTPYLANKTKKEEEKTANKSKQKVKETNRSDSVNFDLIGRGRGSSKMGRSSNSKRDRLSETRFDKRHNETKSKKTKKKKKSRFYQSHTNIFQM